MSDLPRQLANRLLGFAPQRRKLAEREGFESLYHREAKPLENADLVYD
jgi:hypothetical protein